MRSCAECEDKAWYQGKDCFGLKGEVPKEYQDSVVLEMTSRTKDKSKGESGNDE